MAGVHRWLVLICLLIVLTHATDFTLADPGLKIRFSKSGLNYGAQTAVNGLSRKVRGMKLPDASGSAHVAIIGSIEYTVSGMTLTSFNTPTSTVSTEPFGWSLKNIKASLHGNWRWKKHHGFIRPSDHGSFDVSLDEWSIAVTVTVGVDAQQRPTVAVRSCNCYAGSTHVKFHGGASWLYNLFSGNIEKSLKSQLQGKLCDAVNTEINVDGNAQLKTMKVTVPLGKVTLDYGLTQPPSFAVDSMESYHKGEIFWGDDRTEAPFSPSPLPEITSDKMVTFWLSEYVINTLGYVDFKHQAIRYNLTKNDLDHDDQGWLNTTCTSFECIGNFADLKTLCPNCSVSINMWVSKAPSLQISTDKGLSGSFEGTLEFYASKSPKNKPMFAFSVKTSVAVELTLKMKGMSLVGSVKDFSVGNTTLIASHIGEKFMPKFKFIMRGLLEQFVKRKLNDLMKTGLELPKLNDLEFVEPEIRLVQNAVVVLTNLKYTG